MTYLRTPQLWIQYMENVDIIRLFLRSERTGDWLQNVHTLYRMVPYMAVSGHNFYPPSTALPETYDCWNQCKGITRQLSVMTNTFICEFRI